MVEAGAEPVVALDQLLQAAQRAPGQLLVGAAADASANGYQARSSAGLRRNVIVPVSGAISTTTCLGMAKAIATDRMQRTRTGNLVPGVPCE